MKNLGGILLIGAGLFVSLNLLHAQTASIGSINGVATPIQAAPPDSIVQATAQAQGLQLVAPADLPVVGGTFWLVTTNGIAAPSPCPPGNLSDFPVYAMADGIYLVDETGGQVVTNADNGGTAESALAAEADAVVNLINQFQNAQAAQLSGGTGLAAGRGAGMAMMMADFSSMTTPTYDTNGLWLEMTNIANGWSYFNLHNSTNFVYAILSTTSLAGGTWNVETELFPTLDQTNVLPFSVQNLDRQNLFLKAMDWTGVTENGNTTPDWWLWEYYGTTALSDTNLDSQGNTLLSDYQNGTDPNIISFTVEAANQYVNLPFANLQLNVTAGTPSYYAVLVNGQTATNWLPFVSTNLTVSLGSTDGVYDVSVGLRGLPADATQTWEDYSFTLDTVPPVVTITSPILGSGAVIKPYLQLQGFANEPLASLSYDINNTFGLATNQNAFVTGQTFDTNQFDFTTNFFQAYDVPLATNGNYITLRLTDRAGNMTTTNFDVVLDYTGATNPPVVNFIWPQDGAAISGNSFTLRGTVSDETASVTAEIADEAGNTNTVAGLVERNGIFWVENLPLTTNGDNTITVTATDAAGNVTTNSLTVSQSDVAVTIDSTPTGAGLYQSAGSVSGTVSDSSWGVTVNGMAAEVDDDGTGFGYWYADNVPIIGQGTATFDAVATPPIGSFSAQGMRLAGRMDDSATPSPSQASLEIEMDPQVVITTYHITKSASTTNSSWGGFAGMTRTKDYVSNWQTNDTGQWGLQSWVETVADSHDQWEACGDADYYTWSSTNADWFADEWMDDCGNGGNSTNAIYYDYDGQIFGLPDEDLYEFGWAGGIDPQWIYHYFANNVHQTISAGGWTAKVAVEARTEMNLFTGGKAQINRRNLIQLQCGAEAYGNLSPYASLDRTLAPWVDVDILPVDLSRLRALGQWVGSDGNLWLMLPDNAALTLNLAAPAKHYDAWATPVKYKMTVTANDNDLSVTNPEFCVGQQVNLQATWSPALPAGTQSSYNWFALMDYVNTTLPPVNPDASSNPDIDPDLLTNNPTSMWWYAAGYKYVFCITSNLFSNGQVVKLNNFGNLSIYRPSVSFVDGQDAIPMLYNGWMELGDDSLGVNNMVFAAQVTTQTNFQGVANWTQLNNREASYPNAGQDTDGQFWLDNDQFYNTVSNLVGGVPYNTSIDPQRTLQFQDAPGVATSILRVPLNIPQSITDQFQTYLVFKPDDDSAGSSIWVTLGVVTWDWTAIKSSTSLTVTNVTQATYSDSDAFPQWVHTGHNKAH
jgi:hypothetical protein